MDVAEGARPAYTITGRILPSMGAIEEYRRMMSKTQWYGIMYGKAHQKVNKEGQYELYLD